MKIAVITGASSGMGREFVYALDRDEEFDELWVIARREQRLLELKEKCRAKIRPIVLDLQTRERFALYRQLDIIDLNARALTAMCYMSVPYMAKGSRIYNMGSMSSWQPVPYINVYGASKAYVLNFSRALGVELKDRGIKVMAVCPGWITTEFFDHAIHDDTISYFNRYYPPEQVIEKALKDMKKGKNASVLGFPERVQVLLVKLLPVRVVMKAWCRQQGK